MRVDKEGLNKDVLGREISNTGSYAPPANMDRQYAQLALGEDQTATPAPAPTTEQGMELA